MMNPGIGEEVGQTARSLITGLSSTPMILAVLIFNLLFIFMIGYVVIKASERWDKEIERWEKLVQACQVAK